MSERTIEVVVSPTGETRITTQGFSGNSCQAASRLLEEALGTRTAEQLTAEFFQPNQAENHRHESA